MLFGLTRVCFHPFLSVIRCSNPNRAACAPVNVDLSSCHGTYSPTVPELSGACCTIFCATCSNVSPLSSATSASIQRKSLYPRTFPPSATFAKTISALVEVNRDPTKVSLTILAHTLVFMSTPLPAANEVYCVYLCFKPGSSESLGRTRPSFQLGLQNRSDFKRNSSGTWCNTAYAPVYVLWSSWNLEYSARVPVLIGPPASTVSHTVSYDAPALSASKHRAHRNSRYEILRPPLVFTLVNTKSASVCETRRPSKPLSLTHFTHFTLSIAPGAPPPKVQNALNMAFKPGTSGGARFPP
mmetsp:Transcript_565/g.2186  ORF Transcript_565/g.2186 Transcript_565/m.2186 type:complete len:298 (+) Transcript_565:760-1653(+)